MPNKPHKQQAVADSKNSGKRVSQTRGQFQRDPKGRLGQYTAAGDPPLTKK